MKESIFSNDTCACCGVKFTKKNKKSCGAIFKPSDISLPAATYILCKHCTKLTYRSEKKKQSVVEAVERRYYEALSHDEYWTL